MEPDAGSRRAVMLQAVGGVGAAGSLLAGWLVPALSAGVARSVVVLVGGLCGAAVFYGYWLANSDRIRATFAEDAAYARHVRRRKGLTEPRRWTWRRLRGQLRRGQMRLEAAQRGGQRFSDGHDLSTTLLQVTRLREQADRRDGPLPQLAARWHPLRQVVSLLDPAPRERAGWFT